METEKSHQKNLKRLPGINPDLYKRGGEPHPINLSYIIPKRLWLSESNSYFSLLGFSWYLAVLGMWIEFVI